VERRVNYGKFVMLEVEHSIVKQIQSELMSIRDLRYFITSDEMFAIDKANEHFSKNDQEDFLIADYDIIGWALKVDSLLSFSKGERRQSQAESLLWVSKAGFSSDSTGRISRTFLEIAMLVRHCEKSWTKNTRYTTSVKGIEPYKVKQITDNLQQVLLKHLRGVDREINLLIPSGLLDEIIDRTADAAEHIRKDTLAELNLLTTEGAPTSLAKTMVNVIERWWLVESTIANPDDMKVIASKIPLEAILFTTGEANQTLLLDDIRADINLTTDNLRKELMRILSYHKEISLRFSSDQQKVESIDPTAGIEVCDLSRLVERIAQGPLWYWLISENLSGLLIRKEVSVIHLRYNLIEEIVSKIENKEVHALMITASAGWGKTGALIQIAQALEKKGRTLALFRGGNPTTRIPRNSVIFVDDVHTLSLSSMHFLTKMKEDGFQIIMTLSQEFELLFMERLSKLKRKGVKLEYNTVRLPKLSENDTARLLKENFPSISQDDYERLTQKINPLNNAPEAIAFLSMQWEHLNRAPIHNLDPSIYSVFKTPKMLFEVLQSDSISFTEINSELAALVILWELGGEILSTHEIFIAQLAKEIAGSQRFPRYFKSFIEPVNLPDFPRVILNWGIRNLFDLTRNPEMLQNFMIGLYRNDTISKFEWECATRTMNQVTRIRKICVGIADSFLDTVLSNSIKKKKIELLPYVAFIGSPRISNPSFVESHYGWLRDISRTNLIKNKLTPLFLSKVLENLAIVVEHQLFSGLEKVVFPIFDMFRGLWQKKVIIPQDEYNASYCELLASIARKRMQRGEFKEALQLFDEGIELAEKVAHKNSHVRLLCDRIQLLRHLSPVFCAEIHRSTQTALDITRRIETLDTRPFEVIVRNQEAMAMLYCGNIESAKSAAEKAERLLLEYSVDPPPVRHTPQLELLKSMAWAHIELGLSEYIKEKYIEARAHFRFAKENLIETRHQREIAQIIGYEPVVLLREGKLSQADTLVAQINIMQTPHWAWFLSGSFVSYYYLLFTDADLGRAEESEELRQTMREFHPIDDDENLIVWFDLLRKIIYHRRKKEYSAAKKFVFKFLNYLISKEQSRHSLFVDYLRTMLSFVLRELGIIFFECSECRSSARVLLASLVYWTPICGSRQIHAGAMLLECLEKSDLDSIEFSHWKLELDSSTEEQFIRLDNEEQALSEYWDYYWVGISDIVSFNSE